MVSCMADWSCNFRVSPPTMQFRESAVDVQVSTLMGDGQDRSTRGNRATSVPMQLRVMQLNSLDGNKCFVKIKSLLSVKIVFTQSRKNSKTKIQHGFL